MSDVEKMTWSNNSVSSKIDKVFHNKDLIGRFLYQSIKETCKSDHKAVFAKFEFQTLNINDKKKKIN